MTYIWIYSAIKVPSTTPMLDQCKENLVTWRRQEMRRVLQYQSIRGFYLTLGEPSKKSLTFVKPPRPYCVSQKTLSLTTPPPAGDK